MNRDPSVRWAFGVRVTETSRKYIQVQTAIELGCYLAGLIEAELPNVPRLRELSIELEAEIIKYLETEYRSGVDEMRKAAQGVRERIVNERSVIDENLIKMRARNVVTVAKRKAKRESLRESD